MRAKLRVTEVNRYTHEGQTMSESVTMTAVAKDGPYPDDGSDENNTFAKFTPSASLTITIANPALFGQHNPGDVFYVDFTRA